MAPGSPRMRGPEAEGSVHLINRLHYELAISIMHEKSRVNNLIVFSINLVVV